MKKKSIMKTLIGGARFLGESDPILEASVPSTSANPNPSPPPPRPPGSNPTQSKSPKPTEPKDGLTWRQFESMVGQVFRLQGYEVTETETGADGGVDLELRTGGHLYLVQCKHWNRDVGVKVARELAGVVAMRDATGGFLVVSGNFTEPAKREFAAQGKIFLVDGRTLKGMAAEVANRPDLAPPPPGAQPDCPRCDSHMVERVARRGDNPGSKFWGCSTYPKCRATRQLEPAEVR